MTSRGPGMLFRLAWIILALASLALMAAGAYAFYAPIEATQFVRITGESFSSLTASDPDVAGYIELVGRLLAVAAMGFGILSLFVTWFGVRDRSPLAINVMWTLPLLTGGLGLAFVLEGGVFVAAILAGVTAILAFALVLARREG